MTGQAPPATGCTHPDLRHRHPEFLGLRSSGHHHVSHGSVKDGGVADNNHARVAQALRTPDGVAPCVSGDVLGPIQDLAQVCGPHESLVEEVEESIGVTVRKGRGSRVCCLKDLLLVAHAAQRDTRPGQRRQTP